MSLVVGCFSDRLQNLVTLVHPKLGTGVPDCSVIEDLRLHSEGVRSSTSSMSAFTVCCCYRNKSPSDDNWATIATVAEKSTRESAKGQAYSVWRLTDLQGTNISFFLFKNAQSGLWKESVGAVVAVFKPQVCCPPCCLQ